MKTFNIYTHSACILYNYCLLTCWQVSKLSTYNLSIQSVPIAVTHSTPISIKTYLHMALIHSGAIDKASISVSANG